MHVTFTSTMALNYAGISMLATAVPNPALSCSAAAPSLTVTTVDAIQTDTAGTACTFTIFAPAGSAVVLTYITTAFSGTTWKVYDGADAAAPLITSATSAAGLVPTTSTGRDLYITTTGTFLPALQAQVEFVAASACTQVAAFADQHVVVTKGTGGAITATSVQVVDGDERVRELVRMLSGLEGSQSGATHAAELLALARQER
jgi:hypothetical protein